MFMERIHQPFDDSDPEVARRIAEAKPIVAKLAGERAKRWPSSPAAQHVHQLQIARGEAELRRIADALGGEWTPNRLEEVVRVEVNRSLSRQGKPRLPAPAVRPRDPRQESPEQREADFKVERLKIKVREEEQRIANATGKLKRLRIDLMRAQNDAAEIRTGAAR